MTAQSITTVLRPPGLIKTTLTVQQGPAGTITAALQALHDEAAASAATASGAVTTTAASRDAAAASAQTATNQASAAGVSAANADTSAKSAATQAGLATTNGAAQVALAATQAGNAATSAAAAKAVQDALASLLGVWGVVKFYDTKAALLAGVSNTGIPDGAVVRVFVDESQSNKFTWYGVNKGAATDPTLSLSFGAAGSYSVMSVDFKRAEA
jgi:hypothetical protein